MNKRAESIPENLRRLTVTRNNGGDPHQPLPGARVIYCRCSLPGLAGFIGYRREVTNVGLH